jgi:peptide/nickel transport system substrate-binding protein
VPDPDPRRTVSGHLVVGLAGGSARDTLDPHNGLTHLDTARAQALYQPLVQLNSHAQSEYVLAEEIIPNKSTSEWIIRLREGVSFHNGKPLTADDVIYTFRRIKTGNAGGTSFPGGNSLGPMNLAWLKALDSRTVLVPFTSPHGSFLNQLAYWYYLYVIPDGFDPVKQKPNGTGPFTYQSFSPGQRSVFTRNRDFWRGGPFADTLSILSFDNNTSAKNALVTGMVHAVGALDGPEMADLATRRGISTVASHTGAITPFTMRMDQPPFHDVRVRQALRLLVDRTHLIDSALDGHGVEANDVFSPYDRNFDVALVRHTDIEQAKSLLRQAGRENLTVELVTAAATTGMVGMATALAEQAKVAGVTIRLRVVDTGTFFGPNYLKWTFSQDFHNYSPYLAQVAQSMLPASPFNETHNDNASYNKLYRWANATLNESTRKQIEYEMQQIDFTQGGYIIPAYPDALDAYSSHLAGYSTSAVGQPLSAFNFENWWFRPG